MLVGEYDDDGFTGGADVGERFVAVLREGTGLLSGDCQSRGTQALGLIVRTGIERRSMDVRQGNLKVLFEGPDLVQTFRFNYEQRIGHGHGIHLRSSFVGRAGDKSLVLVNSRWPSDSAV
jgi:hypothetical protein